MAIMNNEDENLEFSNKETERIGEILKQLMTKEIDKLKNEKEIK